MFSIGVAAKRSGVGIEAIRYYEREAVVPAAERASNGRRLYDEKAIARLRFVKRCRDLGFSIQQVKALLALAPMGAEKCGQASGIGREHLEEIRRKIADLQALEAGLEELLANCDVGKLECPMLRQLFEQEE